MSGFNAGRGRVSPEDIDFIWHQLRPRIHKLGVEGPAGKDGADGAPGTDGADGEPGPAGADATPLALKSAEISKTGSAGDGDIVAPDGEPTRATMGWSSRDSSPNDWITLSDGAVTHSEVGLGHTMGSGGTGFTLMTGVVKWGVWQTVGLPEKKIESPFQVVLQMVNPSTGATWPGGYEWSSTVPGLRGIYPNVYRQSITALIYTGGGSSSFELVADIYNNSSGHSLYFYERHLRFVAL